MGVSTSDRGDTTVVMLAGSCADTTAATTGWVDVRPYKGDLIVTATVGTMSGTVTGKLRRATSSGGAGAADITGATFTAVTEAGHTEAVSVPKGLGPFIQYVGTIVGGPAILGVTMRGMPASAG